MLKNLFLTLGVAADSRLQRRKKRKKINKILKRNQVNIVVKIEDQSSFFYLYLGGVMLMVSGPCKDCKKRHKACWDTCSAYQEYHDKIQVQKEVLRNIDGAGGYFSDKPTGYKTKYGWRF